MLFYKYAGHSGIKVLEDLRLKVTPPNEFNDRFELTPRSKLTVTLDYLLGLLRNEPEWFRRPYEEMVQNDKYPHNFERFLSNLPRVIPLKFKEFKRRYREELIKNDIKSIDEAGRVMGILCVSRSNNSIAMWSHYANHHQGVVFGLHLVHSCFTSGYATEFRAVRYRKNRYPRWMPYRLRTSNCSGDHHQMHHLEIRAGASRYLPVE